jgi:hypothetical protein
MNSLSDRFGRMRWYCWGELSRLGRFGGVGGFTPGSLEPLLIGCTLGAATSRVMLARAPPDFLGELAPACRWRRVNQLDSLLIIHLGRLARHGHHSGHPYGQTVWSLAGRVELLGPDSPLVRL